MTSFLRLLSVFVATGLPLTVPAAPDPPRPLVLMLPGRGYAAEDTAALRRDWSAALGDGLLDLTGHRLLRDGDLRLVWYADAIQDDEAAACPAHDHSASDATTPWARDMASTMASAGTLMIMVAGWLGGAEGDALRALGGDLAYLGDEDRRCRAEGRLADALLSATTEGRPVVLVAHSFGALVGYHHLRTRTDGPPVERFVTIGSLLGHPELRQLLLAGHAADRLLPDGVGSWVNVRDPRDPLSAPLTGIARGEEGIEDRTTEKAAGRDPHDPVRYLLDPATTEAVLTAWCAAADDASAGSAEPACAAGAGAR